MVYDFFEELKEIIKEKIKWFWDKFKYALIVASFIICIMFIFLLKPSDPTTTENQQLFLFGITLENWLQWITIVTLPYTASWAIYQFKKQRDAKKQEKATQIAKEFSEDILNKCGLIYSVYNNSTLNDILKFDKTNYDDFKFFNVDELRKIYDDDFPTTYTEQREKLEVELDYVYHQILRMNVTPYTNDKLQLKMDIKDKDGNIIKKINILENPFKFQNSNLPYHFSDLENDVLNKLEYICMDISSKATDSKFIYQSLHQMFLRTVRTLAVTISLDNKNFSDKFYTNIIHVYNDWTAKYMNDLKKEEQKKEKINKILNPKIKTV